VLGSSSSLFDFPSVVFLATGDFRLSSIVSPSEAEVSNNPEKNTEYNQFELK